jgi:CRP-like cAMP-binding protein
MTDYALPNFVEMLSPDGLATLRSLGSRKEYTDSEILHFRGDDASMGVVVQGTVKLYRHLRGGQQILTASMTPGQNFGDVLLFGAGRRSHTGIAVGHTIVDHYNRESFFHLLEHRDIARALYQAAAYRLALALDIADDIRFLSLEVRLAKTIALIQLSAGGGDRVECLQEDLATLLGVTAVTLSKAFKHLRREGLVETGYRYVTVPDPGRLRAWIEQHSLD